MKSLSVKKILIVDDEEYSRLYLAQLIRELYPGFQLSFAATVDEALFLIKSDRYDLIMLDVEMPGMSGLELLVEIRKSFPCVPVLFVSAYKVADYIQKAIRLNAVDYIDKPVDPIELDCAINKCFEEKKSVDTRDEPEDRLKLFTAQGDMLFCADDILYFESAKRNSIAYFCSGTNPVVVRENLIGLKSLLPVSSFLRVGRQYIVNKKYVKFISRSNRSITLDTGQKQIRLERISPEAFSAL